MREIDKKLPAWNYSGQELALWRLDQRINDRGFLIDMDLVHGAIRAVDRAQKRLAEQTVAITNGEVQAATQRDAMLKHLVEAYGVALPDMQRGTLERRTGDPDLPSAVKELFAYRPVPPANTRR